MIPDENVYLYYRAWEKEVQRTKGSTQTPSLFQALLRIHCVEYSLLICLLFVEVSSFLHYVFVIFSFASSIYIYLNHIDFVTMKEIYRVLFCLTFQADWTLSEYTTILPVSFFIQKNSGRLLSCNVGLSRHHNRANKLDRLACLTFRRKWHLGLMLFKALSLIHASTVFSC